MLQFKSMKRRDFVSRSLQVSLALSAFGFSACRFGDKKQTITDKKEKELFFKISLAQWSLHRALQDGSLKHLDFAAKSRSFGCEGVEYVNSFFIDKAKDLDFLKEMNSRANGEGQQNVLIMIDREGGLANADDKERLNAIENHLKWIDAAHFLGCHAIRVNLAGGINKDDAVKASIDSLAKLSDYARGSNINILVENHGGFSSNGAWMTRVFSQIDQENCGTLPDFGNFCIERGPDGCIELYDRYKGMAELLPYAKAVSAKSHEFDENGNEVHTDFSRVMKMVKDVGYQGFVGIEYEGSALSEDEGVKKTYDLLVKVGRELS